MGPAQSALALLLLSPTLPPLRSTTSSSVPTSKTPPVLRSTGAPARRLSHPGTRSSQLPPARFPARYNPPSMLPFAFSTLLSALPPRRASFIPRRSYLASVSSLQPVWPGERESSVLHASTSVQTPQTQERNAIIPRGRQAMLFGIETPALAIVPPHAIYV